MGRWVTDYTQEEGKRMVVLEWKKNSKMLSKRGGTQRSFHRSRLWHQFQSTASECLPFTSHLCFSVCPGTHCWIIQPSLYTPWLEMMSAMGELWRKKVLNSWTLDSLSSTALHCVPVPAVELNFSVLASPRHMWNQRNQPVKLKGPFKKIWSINSLFQLTTNGYAMLQVLNCSTR